MAAPEMSNTLWALAKLFESGVDVDVQHVRAMCAETPRVVGRCMLTLL